VHVHPSLDPPPAAIPSPAGEAAEPQFQAHKKALLRQQQQHVHEAAPKEAEHHQGLGGLGADSDLEARSEEAAAAAPAGMDVQGGVTAAGREQEENGSDSEGHEAALQVSRQEAVKRHSKRAKHVQVM